MTQKDLIKKINKQTRSLNKRNARKLHIKISREEIAHDHVMVDVESQRKEFYLNSHDEMEFHNVRYAN